MSRASGGPRRPAQSNGYGTGRGSKGGTAPAKDSVKSEEGLDDWLAARRAAGPTRAPSGAKEAASVPAATAEPKQPEVARTAESAEPTPAPAAGSNHKAESWSMNRLAGSNGTSKQQTGFRTDTQISGTSAPSGARELARWDAESASQNSGVTHNGLGLPCRRGEAHFESHVALEGSLEELSSGKVDSRHWDQFERNRQWFGYESTFKEDLSQYTTPLDVKKVSSDQKKRAAKIAEELGDRSHYDVDDTNGDWDGDEEDLFSSVGISALQKGAKKRQQTAHPAPISEGQALLAALKTGPSEAGASGAKPGDRRGKLRDLLNTVNKRRGEEAPAACPFSGQQFGDISQLIAFWKEAMPREAGEDALKGKTSCVALTELIWRHCFPLRWGDFEAEAGLASELQERVEASEGKSVWKAVMDKLCPNEDAALADKTVGEVVDGLFKMRVWQRHQRVEHLELLELFTMCFGLHLLQSENVPELGS